MRFRLIAIVVRLAPHLIAKVTVAYLIPFIVEIPPVAGSFFLNGTLSSPLCEGVSRRGRFTSCSIRIIVSVEGEKRETEGSVARKNRVKN